MTPKNKLQKEFNVWADQHLPYEFKSGLGYMDTPIGRSIYRVEQESRRLKAFPIFEAGYIANSVPNEISSIISGTLPASNGGNRESKNFIPDLLSGNIEVLWFFVSTICLCFLILICGTRIVEIVWEHIK